MVSNGFAPYGLFEFPPAVGKIPPHRTDAGAFLLADAYGAKRTIYVTDVDGVHNGDAELIPRVSAGKAAAKPVGVNRTMAEAMSLCSANCGLSARRCEVWNRNDAHSLRAFHTTTGENTAKASTAAS